MLFLNKFIELLGSYSVITIKTKVSITAILTHYVVKYRRMTLQLKKQSMENDTFIAIFRNLANLYGQEFKSISVGEQYVYDSNLKGYVPKEHELDTFGKEAEKIENQDFQIIRDPLKFKNCI